MNLSWNRGSAVGVRWCSAAVLAAVFGCKSGEVKPVDIYPEDNCSHCRMAISDQRFAAEIIDTRGDAFKFDDIGCMLTFMVQQPDVKTKVLFVKDFETKEWIPYDKAVIIDADVQTPMGSGKVAFADAGRAKRFERDLREKRQQ